MLLKSRDIVLFQGDSITDCSRDRESYEDLGRGYAMMAAAYMGIAQPELDLTFLNRGIGGDRVADLEARWTEDCLQLRPTVVSITIGINNTWRRYDRNDPTSDEFFENSYRHIAELTKSILGARLVFMEPFLLPVKVDQQRWREDLDSKIRIVRRLASEYRAGYVPLDELFARAAVTKPAYYWAPDGVHPSPAGHALIARAWLQAMNAI